MKKRRMRLMALMLTLVVTFTSVVPAGATVLGTDNTSGAEVTTEPPSNQDEVGNTGNDEGTPDSTDGTQATDNTASGDNQSGNQDNTGSGESGDNQGSTGEGSDQTPDAEEIEGDNWTVQETTDAEGNTVSVILRKYTDAATKSELLDKWVYSATTSTWANYKSDAADAVAEKLEDKVYQVGVMNTGDGEEQELLELFYWLDANGKGKSGWKLSDDGNTFSYFCKGDEDELVGGAGDDKEMLSKFFAGIQKNQSAITEGFYQDINGDNYYLKDGGIIVKDSWGLIKDDAEVEHIYYFDKDGKQDKTKKGLQTVKIGDEEFKCYLKDDFTLLKNDSVLVDGRKYVFDENGRYVKDYKPVKERWVQNSKGWWYQNEDGTWPKDCWKEINNKKYYFDGNGYMKSGWFKLSGKWYYLGGANDGAMKVHWQKVNGKWYYLSREDGTMVEGWTFVNNQWFYLTPGSGAMKTGWLKTGGKWYYLKTGNGAMAERWNKVSGKWYYMTPGTGKMVEGWLKLDSKWYYLTPGSGKMAEGWVKASGKWYYLNPGSGKMAEGWKKLNGKWYYLNPGSGAMKTGWYLVNNVWYYSYSSGAMAANTWVGNYYLTGSGAMATSRWIGDKYVDKNGKYVPGYGTVNVDTPGNWEKKNNKWYYLKDNGQYAKNEKIAWGKKWYYLDGNGVMVTGWRYVDGYKLYFNSSGALVQDVSSMLGKVQYKVRVNRTKCVVTILAKDGNNGWTIPVKTMTCSVGLPATPTPAGTFYIGAQDRWHILMGPSWGQYTSHVVNGIFIHSVAGWPQSINNLSSVEYNKLGQPASHGCIRLCVRDAKWIYTNCSRGTQVQIGDGFSEPFDKPATIKLPNGSGLQDPTQC